MSTLKVNNITDSTGLVAPIFPPGSAQLNPMAGREDKIINGDFSIWQRGVTFATSNYGADRWFNNCSTGTVTQSLQAFAPGEKLGVTNPYQFLRQTVSGQSATTSLAATTQRIESARSYSGETITVLFWARRSSGSGNMSVDFDQVFGGVVGNNVLGFGTTSIPLTNAWTPYAVVVSVPSITGKALTPGTDYLGLNFWISAGSIYNSRTNNLGLQNIGVDLWGIHIRQGAWTAAATADYRPRDLGTETLLCQRYYEVVNAHVMGWSGGVSTLLGTTVRFAVPKRVGLPTVTPISTPENVGMPTVMNYAPISSDGFRFYGNSTLGPQSVYTSRVAAFDAEIY